jgi:hypothetical protein
MAALALFIGNGALNLQHDGVTANLLGMLDSLWHSIDSLGC